MNAQLGAVGATVELGESADAEHAGVVLSQESEGTCLAVQSNLAHGLLANLLHLKLNLVEPLTDDFAALVGGVRAARLRVTRGCAKENIVRASSA